MHDLFVSIMLKYKISWILVYLYALILFLPEIWKINAPGPVGYVVSCAFNFLLASAIGWILSFIGELLRLVSIKFFYIWHCLLVTFLSFYSISEMFLISVFGLQWNAFTFQLLNETTDIEIIGFFETYGSLWQFYTSVLGGMALICATFFIIKKFGLSLIIASPNSVILRSVMVVAYLVLAIYESPCFSADATTNFNKSDKLIRRDGIWNLYQSILMYNAEKDLLDVCVDSQNNVGLIQCSAKSRNIVLVIGETYNRHHSSLYGYEFETMPECKDLGAIIFSDVVSTANATTTAFQYFLSFSEVKGRYRWCDTPLFPAIFKQADYNTVFYSNQYVSEGGLDFYDASAGFFNHPAIYGKLFNKRNHRLFTYDMDLIDDYLQKRNNLESDSLNLIIFHLHGQHSPAVERYPEDFRFFTCRDYSHKTITEEQRQYIADYDNATRYNDAVVSRIVRMYKDQDAIVIYFADHGEEVYDFRNKAGRFFDFCDTGADGLHNQIDVPFMVFASEQYKTNHPEIIDAIVSAKDKPFMTDLLPHLLLGLSGIDCKWYDETKDLFNSQYDTLRPRIVSGTDIDYNEVCAKFVD